MADKQIDELASFTAVDRTTDLLPMVDVSADSTVHATPNQILGFSGGNPVSTSDTQTLSNKTLGITNTVTLVDNLFTLQDNLDNTKQAQFQLSGITTGTTRTLTLPNASDTLVGRATTDTLTNKTISGGAINNATIDNPVLQTDTVSEHTAANGVTVDGMNIKDGKLNTNNSVVTANITDSAVTPAKLNTGNGSSWAWQTWTPTFTNLTANNAVVTAAYCVTGKTVNFILRVVFGNTSAMGTNPQFSLPVTASSNFNSVLQPIGMATLEDSGTTTYQGTVSILTTTTARIFLWQANGTYVGTDATITAAVPMTWTTNDAIRITGAYEMA